MLSGNGTVPKVVVVGGSLGGLFNAIALRSLGCAVEVFEKSSGLMQDRGAGIVFQQEVAEFLTRYEVAPLEAVAVPVRTRRYLAADGSPAHEEPMPQAMTSWDMLYRKLRAAFGDEHYHVGVRLTGFETANDEVTARFEGGLQEACDLLVGAGGPGSTVRQQLLPNVRSEYAGYVAWRGVVLEHQAPELAAEFANRFTFFQAPHTHILCYLIPGPDGSLAPGHRRLNWVWYLNAAPGEELGRVLNDNGRVRRMAVGRVCLTGDAAFVPRPHTAASTAKAAANALALADCLAIAKGGVVEVLQGWEPDQLALGEWLRGAGQM